MGACKSRQKKSGSVAKTVDEPLLSDPKEGKPPTFKLRADAQPYVVPTADEPDVKEPWEIFLEQKKRDLTGGPKGLRRQQDGSYTAAYRNLLVRPAKARDWSPDRKDFDVRGAWRSSARRAPSPKVTEPKEKKRKPSALKKAILAQRENVPNALWQTFEEHVQKLAEKETAAPEAQPGSAKDDISMPVQVPFGLADRYYFSDAEDGGKSQRHREPTHALIREFVTMNVTPALEAATTETLFALRRLKMQELGCGVKTRRYTVGFREVTRLMAQKSVKCLIFAPDVERTSGVLEDKIACLLQACEEQQVPVVFALSRRQLGAAIQKNVAVSVLSIQEVRGASEPFERMLAEASKARCA